MRVCTRLAAAFQEDWFAFMTSAYMRTVLVTWGKSIVSSIADIECGNSKIKRFYTSGRPETFSSTAAKGLISDAAAAFARTYNRGPADALTGAQAAVEAAAKRHRKGQGDRGRSKGSRCAFDIFASEQHAAFSSSGSAAVRHGRRASADEISSERAALSRSLSTKFAELSWEDKALLDRKVRDFSRLPRPTRPPLEPAAPDPPGATPP